MSWEQFCDGVVKIFNTPTCIAGVTIGTLLFTILVIFSKTSLGKKAFNKLKGALTKATNDLKNAKDELVEVKSQFDEYKEAKEQEIKEIKETYEVLLVGAKQQTEKVEQLLITVGQNINNKNIKEEVNKYVDNKKDEAYTQVSEIVEIEKEKARSEYEQEIIELKKELEEIKASVKEVKDDADSIDTNIHNSVANTVSVTNEVIEDVKERKDNITNL